MSAPLDIDAIEAACEVMHNAYEQAAAMTGWETQQASRKPWADVPEANKATMRVAVSALLSWLTAGAAVTPTPQETQHTPHPNCDCPVSTPEAATEATEAIAAVALDELSSWDELAEAMGAKLFNHEQGCSGEYETTMEWPDGRVARSGDVLQIIPSYPTAAPSGLQRATEQQQ